MASKGIIYIKRSKEPQKVKCAEATNILHSHSLQINVLDQININLCKRTYKTSNFLKIVFNKI